MLAAGKPDTAVLVPFFGYTVSLGRVCATPVPTLSEINSVHQHAAVLVTAESARGSVEMSLGGIPSSM